MRCIVLEPLLIDGVYYHPDFHNAQEISNERIDYLLERGYVATPNNAEAPTRDEKQTSGNDGEDEPSAATVSEVAAIIPSIPDADRDARSRERMPRISALERELGKPVSTETRAQAWEMVKSSAPTLDP